MPDSEVTAPALSTFQDEEAFSYAKIDKTKLTRTHLHLQPGNDDTEKLGHYYDIDQIVAFLSQKETIEGEETPKYKCITLQFPDSLICDSAQLAQELQKRMGLSQTIYSVQAKECEESKESKETRGGCCGTQNSCGSLCERSQPDSSQRIWILADTSYSSCCVDEVASEHVKADLVVHFGDACLNPVANLSSAYVFGKPHINVEDLVTSVESRYPVEELGESKIVLMADAPHTYILKQACDRLRERYPNIVYADVSVDCENSTIIGYKPEQPAETDMRILNRVFRNVSAAGDEGSDSVLSEYELFHITTPKAPRLLQLTTKFQSVTTYDPATNTVSQGPYPNLMRRYRYMHMARAAGTIGILVNTLSLANTKALVNGVGRKIKEAGKKHYIFVVGKPNVAKLANFDAIDMWCILGCDHQGIIIDQTSDYFKPIVTPYELLLALSDELTWTGKWVTDFNRILSDLGEEVKEEKESADQADDDAPEFNPVTGKYVSTSRPLRRLQHLQITQDETEPESNALVKKLSLAVAIKGTVSTSAAHLQTRTWTGLGSDWDTEADQEGALVEDGRSGIARGYDFDRENKPART